MSGIIVSYDKDIMRGTLTTLEASELGSLVKPGMKVSIKPNLVFDKPASSGATTHSEVVEGLIIYLKEHGVHDIEIIESSWVGGDTRRAFSVCGYEDLSKRYNVPLFDLKQDNSRKIKTPEFELDVNEKALDTNFLINVPVLKAHCMTTLTCNLKNLKGCIPDSEKRRYHTIGLHRPIAFLNTAIKTHFCLVDGICGDLTFEEGGTPIERNMILAGSDPVLVDSYCAELLGYCPDEIEHLAVAAKIGVGQLYSADCQITELNAKDKPTSAKSNNETVKRLAAHINEDQACSACYSALICALNTTKTSPPDKISVGQGLRGKRGKLGCGNCANGFDKFVKGCPPRAAEVVEFLRGLD